MERRDLSPETIRSAYARGIFPMTLEDDTIGWMQPQRRALFPLSGMRVSHSLRRTIASGRFAVTFDTCFEEVMRGCLRPDGNWISRSFIDVYTEIHFQGWGHSAEVWDGARLVGGMYGVALGACFFAESMFHRERDASKVGLWASIERCRELGFHLFDAQFMTPHLASLGAYEVGRGEFERLLANALLQTTAWSGV